MKAFIVSFIVSSGVAIYATSLPAVAFDPWDNYDPPRMADGTPDMQGIWTNASITVLERLDGIDKLVLNEAEAAFLVRMTMKEALIEEDALPTDPDAPALEVGSEDGVGGYNRFWVDFGTQVATVKGELRSSWIVDPENGKLPWSEQGAATARKVGQRMRSNFDDPEVRPPAERCTIGFGSTGGPPMINVLYNNHYQIVQTPETVAILVEMNHNTRLIRINDDHRRAEQRGWLGDSVGRWDGDTLVVNTTNFHPDAGMRGAIRHRFYLSAEAIVEERFTRVADDTIFYQFAVDDPATYSRVWRAEMVLRRAEGPIYEYACHEANYSLPNILGGARRQEIEAAGAVSN